MSWIYDKALERAYATPPVKDVPHLRVAQFTDSSACAYYRCIKPGTELEKAGLISSVFLEDLPDDQQLVAMSLADVLVLERPWNEIWLETLPKLRFGGVGIIIETDDWIDGIAKASLGKVNSSWTKDKVDTFNEITQYADCMIVSTDRLGKEFQNKGITTFVAYNHVDLDDRWDVQIEDRASIVLFSGPTHENDLEIVKEPLRTILTNNLQINLDIIGTPPFWAYEFLRLFPSQIRIDHQWRDIFEYPKALAEAGAILLIPLHDNEFNQVGKSDVKYLEGTMTGKVCVASSVGVYKKTITHNKNGFLAKTEEDWIKYIQLLIDSKKLRTRLLESAVDYVLNKRMYHNNLSSWYTAYKYAYLKAQPRKRMAMEVVSERERKKIHIYR